MFDYDKVVQAFAIQGSSGVLQLLIHTTIRVSLAVVMLPQGVRSDCTSPLRFREHSLLSCLLERIVTQFASPCMQVRILQVLRGDGESVFPLSGTRLEGDRLFE